MVSQKKQEKATRIENTLAELYPETPIPLDHTSPYTLLVAVALSAQTTDKKVNEVTPTLFQKANTPEKMSRLDVEEVRMLIREIGLAPTKAKNLVNAAKMIMTDFNGKVPQNMEMLERLPGVGHKTASVVMSQAFGVPAFPVDTHIHRLAKRWGLSNGHNVEQTEADLKAIFSESSWNALHLRIIFFGRAYCPARSHDLEACPICSWASTAKWKKLEKKHGSFKKALNML